MMEPSLMFCHVETEKNFVFCAHPKDTGKKINISLVVTDNKDPEGEETQIQVNFCPFCGFSYPD